jgi:hypothetical protein
MKELLLRMLEWHARATHGWDYETWYTGRFVDRWADRRLDLWVDRKATLDRAPIETVSLSEAGAERLFQGIEVRFGLAVALEPGKPWRARFRVAPGRAGSPA